MARGGPRERRAAGGAAQAEAQPPDRTMTSRIAILAALLMLAIYTAFAAHRLQQTPAGECAFIGVLEVAAGLVVDDLE